MKEIAIKVFKYLLKKPNYLKKSVWFIILTLVAEIGALSKEQDLIRLSHEWQASTELPSWLKWIIKLAEALFIGGSWFVISSLIGLLLFVSVLLILTRKAKSVLIIGAHHFDSQLTNIETSFIQSFRTNSAKELTKKILEEIDRSYIKPEDKSRLQARAYHILGKCRSDKEDPNEGYKHLVKSYELEPTNFDYKERSCISLYFLDRKEESLRLANEILAEDPGSQRAAAIIAGSNPNFSLNDFKSNILQGQTFRRLYALILANQGDQEGTLSFLKSEFSQKKIPSSLDYKNIDYWEVIARFSFHAAVKDLKGYVHEKPDLSGNELLRYAHHLLKMIHNTIAKTEAAETVGYQTTIYYYHYANYLLTYSADSISEMKLLNDKLPEYMQSRHRDELVFCHNQAGLYQEAVNICSEMDAENDSFTLNMLYIAYRGLGDIHNAEASFSKYCRSLPIIDQNAVNNLFAFFNDYTDELERDRIPEVYKAIIEPLTFADDDERRVLFCYAHRYINSFAEVITKELPHIVSNFEKFRSDIRNAALVVLQAHKQYEATNQFIEKYYDWKNDDNALRMYTVNLLNLSDDGVKLLEVLKYRRDHLPEEWIYLEELKIHAQLDAFDNLLSLAEEGIRRFPDNINFRFYFIYSLFKKGNKEGLIPLLTDELLNQKFSRNQKFEIARICALNEKLQLGLELCYRETIQNYDSPVLKQNYIAFLLHHPRTTDWPDIVSEGTWILIEHLGKQELLEITPLAIKENTYAAKAMGLKVKDSYHVKAPFKSDPDQITILHIYDRYSGLFNKILKETESSNVTGLGFTTFKFDSSDPQSFIQMLVKEFGQDGDQRKKTHDDAFRDYDLGKISFTELVRTLNNKLLDVFLKLTGPFSNGFRTVPLPVFKGIKLDPKNEYVIDLTSLLMLEQLSEKYPGLNVQKFIISQYAIEIIENELHEAKLYGESRATLTITSKQAVPYFEEPEVTRSHIQKLKQLLEWIKNHCEIKFSTDKLNMSLKHPEIIREDDLYYNYMIDTVFLSQGRTLISDDLFHYQKFAQSYQTISLEFYLIHTHEERYRSDLLPYLIEKHYVGIRINANDIKREFKKLQYGGKSTYDYCLENLPFAINQDTTILNDCAEFAKYIYLEPIALDVKKQYTQKVFVHCLRNFPDPLWLKKGFPSLLLNQFQLMLPEYQHSVLDDALAALQILNRVV